MSNIPSLTQAFQCVISNTNLTQVQTWLLEARTSKNFLLDLLTIADDVQNTFPIRQMSLTQISRTIKENWTKQIVPEEKNNLKGSILEAILRCNVQFFLNFRITNCYSNTRTSSVPCSPKKETSGISQKQ